MSIFVDDELLKVAGDKVVVLLDAIDQQSVKSDRDLLLQTSVLDCE